MLLSPNHAGVSPCTQGAIAATAVCADSFFSRNSQWQTPCFPVYPFQLSFLEDTDTSSPSFPHHLHSESLRLADFVVDSKAVCVCWLVWNQPRKHSDRTHNTHSLPKTLKSKMQILRPSIKMLIKEVTAGEVSGYLPGVWWLQVSPWKEGMWAGHRWWLLPSAPLADPALWTRPCVQLTWVPAFLGHNKQ